MPWLAVNRNPGAVASAAREHPGERLVRRGVARDRLEPAARRGRPGCLPRAASPADRRSAASPDRTRGAGRRTSPAASAARASFASAATTLAAYAAYSAGVSNDEQPDGVLHRQLPAEAERDLRGAADDEEVERHARRIDVARRRPRGGPASAGATRPRRSRAPSTGRRRSPGGSAVRATARARPSPAGPRPRRTRRPSPPARGSSGSTSNGRPRWSPDAPVAFVTRREQVGVRFLAPSQLGDLGRRHRWQQVPAGRRVDAVRVDQLARLVDHLKNDLLRLVTSCHPADLASGRPRTSRSSNALH